jgi:hypothetical protein
MSQPPAVSRQSPATSASSLSPSPRAVSGVITKFLSSNHQAFHPSILSSVSSFTLLLHPPQYRRLSPTSSQKGDSPSDPSPSLQKFNSILSILSIESPSHSRAIHRLILVAVAPLQVRKRGILSPIHVSSLVLQPRHSCLHPLHRTNFLKLLLESSIGQSSSIRSMHSLLIPVAR